MLIEEEQNLRWYQNGFDVHSDPVWRIMMFEQHQPEDMHSFNNWLTKYRDSLPQLTKNQECIVAMIGKHHNAIDIWYGSAIYIGETHNAYVLKNSKGVHEHYKNNQLVFDSSDSFEQFEMALRLKYEDVNTKITLAKQSVMETTRKVNNNLDRIRFLAGIVK